MGKFSDIANGISTAKQVVSLVVLGVAGIVSVTLLFTQVDANEEKSKDNMEQIEALKTTLGGIKSQQRVIIMEIAGEKEKNKEFRDRTDRSLDRILDRLTPRGGNNR